MLHRACLVLSSVVVCASSLPAQQQLPAVTVLDSHWVALRFDPQYPHGRHTQNPLPGDSLKLPTPESLMIKGQAGQSSDNLQDTAEFRIPVPDFAADAGINRAVLVADVTGAGAGTVNLEGSEALRTGCTGGLTVVLRDMDTPFCADVTSPVNPAEFTVKFSATVERPIEVFGESASHRRPVLLLHTHDAMNKSAYWSTTEQSGLEMPKIAPLFDQFLRDTSIVAAPDGNYYMTGTTGGPEMMIVTSDISVWKSPDLQHWSPVRDLPRQSTVVWNLDRDGPRWMQPITMRDGEPFRPLWAPEIHYINGTFWIPFSVPRRGITMLKSTSGKAEGPYQIATKPDQPLSTGIDASLFQDDDGKVYSLYGGGWIAKMKPEMSGLAEPYRHITSASGREVGFEGVYLFKKDGRYYLTCADFVLGEYNTYIATAASLNGPWSERYLAVPHAGHENFFRDKQGRWWSTFFGNDRHSPFSAKPAIVPMMMDGKGRWRPDPSYLALGASDQHRPMVQVTGAIGPSNGQPQQVGVMPSTPAKR